MYFYEKRYRGLGSDVKVFYDVIEEELGRDSLVKVGTQMGLGPTFAKPGSTLWGGIRVNRRGGNMEVLVSTINRRIAKRAMLLGVGLLVPYFGFLGLLTTLHVLPDPKSQPVPVLALVFGYAVVIIVLGYEWAIGLFPATRTLQKVLMRACDQAALKLGAEPIGKFALATKWVKVRRVSLWEWRIWKKEVWRPFWQPWPDMITEEEFLKQTA